MKPLESVFSFDQNLLKKLTADTDDQQKLWLSGYLYGLYAASQQSDRSLAIPAEAPAPVLEKPTVTVLYGSHTGNCKKLAQQTVEQAHARGFEVQLADMNDYQGRKLKDEKLLLVIVSTHGEGEPPTSAETLYEFIHSARAPKLNHTKFSVLALGDRSYVQFCQTGIDFDTQLEKLGAQRLADRVDCDVDFAEDAARWMETVLAKIASETAVATNGHATAAFVKPQVAATAIAQYNRKNPFAATVLEKIQLNGRGSTKETWHVEVSLEGADLPYEPGDSLGIVPENAPEVVGLVLKNANVSDSLSVDWNDSDYNIAEILTTQLELNLISRDVLEKIFAKNNHPQLKELLNNPALLKDYVYGRDLADVLHDFPADWTAQELVQTLRKLQPRLYSLASSLLYAPDEAHLTIGAVRYETLGRKRTGTASTFVADDVAIGETLKIFVERNEYFRLPQNADTPIIMVGAGTGVAPFRAFVQEREAQGASGKSWLFFGNPHFTTDFLYQTEWQQALKKGNLSRLDVAFSRDQKDKVYCQHKLLQNSREVFNWLENGAYFYVCGDKNRLAPDVEAAVLQIVTKEGGFNNDKAIEYVKHLKKQRRYLEDVY